jgi:hypothetical protein
LTQRSTSGAARQLNHLVERHVGACFPSGIPGIAVAAGECEVRLGQPTTGADGCWSACEWLLPQRRRRSKPPSAVSSIPATLLAAIVTTYADSARTGVRRKLWLTR